MSEYAALAGRVRQALADLEHVVRRAEELMRKAQQTGDDGYLDGHFASARPKDQVPADWPSPSTDDALRSSQSFAYLRNT